MANTRKRKSPEAELNARLTETLAAAAIGQDTALCVALSGGVDSVALLHLLATRREHIPCALTAAHVHHGLSPNADAWRDFCMALCRSLQVPLQVFHVNVERCGGNGIEAAAREARHSVLATVSSDWLALGHHLDDQAETLLFRLLRGAGVQGAAAMAAVEPGRPGRLRPLLAARRDTIVAYAQKFGLSWVEDESNADRRYARNWLRHDILPRLENVFPATAGTLARAAAHFREAAELLDELAQADQRDCGGENLDLACVLNLSDRRLRNLLRWKIRQGGCAALSSARLNEILRQVRTAGGPLHLPVAGSALCVYRNRLWLEKAELANAATRPWHGQASLAWGQGNVRFLERSGEGVRLDCLRNAQSVTLTNRWQGLCMRIAPDRPMRTFKNLCQEAGIPLWMRDRLPVLRIDGAPAWIGLIGLSADFSAVERQPAVMPLWRY